MCLRNDLVFVQEISLQVICLAYPHLSFHLLWSSLPVLFYGAMRVHVCCTNSSPGEMQFYSGVASIVAQIPFCVLLMDHAHAWQSMDSNLLIAYVLNGFFFHGQTLVNYVLLDYISPVTHRLVHLHTAQHKLIFRYPSIQLTKQVEWNTFVQGLNFVYVSVFATR